jgi:glycosyltransferase involved in cell wall biosynthesis
MYPDYGRIWRVDGIRVTLISSPGPDVARFGKEEGVTTVGIPIEREVAPFRDLISLYRLWRELSRLEPNLIECGTPKAGLLAGVPVRVYTLHGLRLEIAQGWRRAVLRLTERLSVRIASETVAVSRGLLRRARALGVVPVDQGTVAGPGSAGGIDPSRFAAVARSQSKGNTIGFVGRLTRDKGIVELVDAFVQVKKNRPNAGLLLVGDFESGDPLPAHTRQLIRSDLSIRRTGFVDDATPFYAAIDVVALPPIAKDFLWSR